MPNKGEDLLPFASGYYYEYSPACNCPPLPQRCTADTSAFPQKSTSGSYYVKLFSVQLTPTVMVYMVIPWLFLILFKISIRFDVFMFQGYLKIS